ncbi:MAG TPA: flagellar basal body P-ring protein FlgI [Terriglobales bacterium]|nr:flagellar basal body P-ring protein FlgI [Terriglobales bacterium]
MNHLCILVTLTLLTLPSCAQDTVSKALIRDVASVEGIRDNPVLGYGVVVGLKNTGDKQQTLFTNQTLANILQRMGVQTPAGTIIVKNVAAVFVTATLPPFARPGTRLDVTVASAGDARSLEGGTLLLTPLYGADGQIYASAQGPLTLGGFSEGGGTNAKQVNHPTTGRIPGGGLVERDSALDLRSLPRLSLLLNDPNFSTAEELAKAVNQEFQRELASVVDSRRVDIDTSGPQVQELPALLARIENLSIEVHHRARVVVNERTGTIVMGKDVRLGAVSILHGNLSIEVATQFVVSQPNPQSRGKTEVVPETNIKAEESPARRIELTEGASVEQLVNGLQRIGATARDVIAILQAIKSAGALEADLQVI